RRAQYLLELLARAHLITRVSQQHFQMHDLLRAYAFDLANTEESPEQRHVALENLFDYFLFSVLTAIDTLYKADNHLLPCVESSGTTKPGRTDRHAARTWLDTERTTLVIICSYTRANGWPKHAIHLAALLARYLDTGGHHAEALDVHTQALS